MKTYGKSHVTKACIVLWLLLGHGDFCFLLWGLMTTGEALNPGTHWDYKPGDHPDVQLLEFLYTIYFYGLITLVNYLHVSPESPDNPGKQGWKYYIHCQ